MGVGVLVAVSRYHLPLSSTRYRVERAWRVVVSWDLTFWGRLILGVFVYSAALYALPWDQRQDPSGAVDWVGAYLGVAGLVLFNFVWK